MTTTDNVLLIILTVLLSLQIIFGIVLITATLKLVNYVKQVVQKAESVVDSVESAAEVFKNTEGKLALFKLMKNLFKLSQRKKK